MRFPARNNALKYFASGVRPWPPWGVYSASQCP